MVNLSSGNRINSAADDAAGLAISEKMEAQTRGVEQGSNNTADMQNLINTAEGGMEGIQNNLHRMRELVLQAGNGTLNQSDRELIRTELNELIDEIEETTERVEFNQISLLNGDADGLHTASSPDGSGTTVSISDMGGLADDLRAAVNSADFLSGNIGESLQAIDAAHAEVGAARAELGAMSNRMDHTINSNSITMLNQMASRSRIADADMARNATDMNRDQVINDMQVLMQRQQQQQEQQRVQVLM
jgi:flagellin